MRRKTTDYLANRSQPRLPAGSFSEMQNLKPCPGFAESKWYFNKNPEEIQLYLKVWKGKAKDCDWLLLKLVILTILFSLMEFKSGHPGQSNIYTLRASRRQL